MNIIVAIAIQNCCIKGQKCNFCQIPEIFSEFEKDLDIFQFDFNYLKKYHSRLVPFLIEIFKADELACECFLNDEFTCSGRDWNNEQKWSISLTESIEYSTELKKRNGEKKYLQFMYDLIYFFKHYTLIVF